MTRYWKTRFSGALSGVSGWVFMDAFIDTPIGHPFAIAGVLFIASVLVNPGKPNG